MNYGPSFAAQHFETPEYEPDTPRFQEAHELNPKADFELRQWRCNQRREELITLATRIRDRAPEGRKAAIDQHLTTFQNAYNYWNTPYDRIGAGHHEAFLTNLQGVLDRFGFIFDALDREYSSVQPSAEVLREVGPSLLQRVQGQPLTWRINVPAGSDLFIRFEQYNSDMNFDSTTTGMGTMQGNGFRVERNPANPTEVTIQSVRGFSVRLPDGRTQTVQEAQQIERSAVFRSL